ncbi:hypothetical protein PFNF135_05441 [Plasmodium falciparum NF135/5.C10]|uniref:Uncharacterized protein n=1 Tax=Plasmodium falciparum NF135/5.C10 TaxID=1036726 RepID=W4I940_PLAFA|nr:hypothetical protein PFNF135_05441 [Plasmodium falciparum NF135/5.C10]
MNIINKYINIYIYIYTSEIYNSLFNLKIKRSLAQHFKKKSVKHILTRNGVTKETILNDKLPKINDEIDRTYNGHKMDENLQDKQKRNHGVNIKLINEYEKYHVKNKFSKSIDCMTRFKNWLYKNIFKKSNFGSYVSTFTGVFGGAAAVSLFSAISGACITKFSVTLVPVFACFGGAFAIIIILLILGTWMLVTWLWQHKEVYNETCGK